MDQEFDLVAWAEVVGIHAPADRPWYFIPAPKADASGVWRRCPVHHERHERLILSRHPCNDGTAWMWIGQCPRCEAVSWAFVREEIPEEDVAKFMATMLRRRSERSKAE
jgi:hypothetical protein